MTSYNANAIILLDKIIQAAHDTKNQIRTQQYESAELTAKTIEAQLKNVKGYLAIYNLLIPNQWKRYKTFE